MPSRPTVSAVRARRAISGSAMPAGNGFGITTPILTIEVLFEGGKLGTDRYNNLK